MSDEMRCEYEIMGARCILLEGHGGIHDTTEEKPVLRFLVEDKWLSMVDILARIEALEKQVREARAWLEENCAFPVDTGDNAPKQATKADFANPEARAALASAAEAQGIQAQAILDELDNDDNALKVPLDNMGEVQTRNE